MDEDETTDEPTALTEGQEATVNEALFPRLLDGEGDDALTEAEGKPPRYRAVVIESGMSKNRTFYPVSVLEASTNLLEGKPIYIEHSEPGDMFGMEGRSIRSRVGWWSEVSFGKEDGVKSVVATANLYQSSPEPWIAERVAEALRQGRPQDVGISIAARGKSLYKRDDEGVYREVTEILDYESADFVSQPAAGGRPLRIAASARKDQTVDEIEKATSIAELLEADPTMTLEQAKAVRPDLFETKKDEPAEKVEESKTKEEVEETKLKETLQSPTAEPSATEIADLRESHGRLDAAVHSMAVAHNRQYLDDVMESKKFPEAIRKMLRERLQNTKVLQTTQTLDEMVEEYEAVHKASMASVPSPTSAISIAYPGMARPGSSVTTLDRIVASMDRFFGAAKFHSADGKTEIAESELFRVDNLAQLYHLLTGATAQDVDVVGSVYESGLLHEAVTATLPQANTVAFGGAASHIPGLPSAPSGLVDLAGVFGISMNRAKGDIYRGQTRWWEPLVSYKDISNMKEQSYVQGDDFPVMPERKELQDYVVIQQGDNVETWMPKEYGHMAQVSRLSIINDDLDIFRDIPMRFAKSATRTINEYVAALFTVGSGRGRDLSDGEAVMHSTHGGNALTAALTRAGLTAGIQVLEEQEDTAGGRLDLQATYLLVPNRLRPTAFELLSSTQVPDSANNAANWLNEYGIESPINVPNWTDVNNWYLMASPAQITSIQLGFLGGRRVPDFIPQSGPTEGINYTHDVMSWKQRWDFGGDFVEQRGVVGSVVA